jgi:hypothetical protein
MTCATRHTCVHGKPARISPHYLDYQHSVVGFCGSMQPVNSFGCDVDGSIKAERIIGSAKVIIYGLGDSDHLDAIVMQFLRHSQGVVTADYDQSIDMMFFQILLYLFHPIGMFLRIRPGSS